ncbi:hypothetical protein Ccrd_018776 [Cynara cardunculus var. scolymus]|uniref:Uncharacterized protein n=1 Tax=Cynara cardunculus var. scolymus TaxID=59895 RepID=A0A103Y5L2_CYNCS|nr:hypothetical protein Ccrd_018776 [Cynara cardunculus var. scolymus]
MHQYNKTCNASMAKKYSESLDNYICIAKRKKESHGFLAVRFIYETCLKTPTHAPSVFPLPTPPDSHAMHRWTKKYSEGLDNYICVANRKKESNGFLAVSLETQILHFYFKRFQAKL